MVLDRRGHQKLSLSMEAGDSLCWSPHGYGLAVSIRASTEDEERSQVVITDNATDVNAPSSVLATFPVPAIYGLDWSTQGNLAIWISEEQRIHIYSLLHPLNTASAPEHILSVPSRLSCGGRGTLRWSPNGAYLAAGGRDGSVRYGHALVKSLPTTQHRVFHLAWSPDSTLLAVASANRSVIVWNIRKQKIVLEWKNLPMVPRAISISRQRWLAVGSNQSDLYLGNIDADYARPSIRYKEGYRQVAWSPQRSEFATLHPKNDSRLLLYGM